MDELERIVGQLQECFKLMNKSIFIRFVKFAYFPNSPGNEDLSKMRPKFEGCA